MRLGDLWPPASPLKTSSRTALKPCNSGPSAVTQPRVVAQPDQHRLREPPQWWTHGGIGVTRALLRRLKLLIRWRSRGMGHRARTRCPTLRRPRRQAQQYIPTSTKQTRCEGNSEHRASRTSRRTEDRAAPVQWLVATGVVWTSTEPSALTISSRTALGSLAVRRPV